MDFEVEVLHCRVDVAQLFGKPEVLLENTEAIVGIPKQLFAPPKMSFKNKKRLLYPYFDQLCILP